jgi:hypothetical protein
MAAAEYGGASKRSIPLGHRPAPIQVDAFLLSSSFFPLHRRAGRRVSPCSTVEHNSRIQCRVDMPTTRLGVDRPCRCRAGWSVLRAIFGVWLRARR